MASSAQNKLVVPTPLLHQMEFRGEVLIYYSGSQAKTCWLDRFGPERTFDIPESEELTSVAERVIRNYIESQAIHYINWFSHGDDWVNCQEGRAKVPADIWYCKITDDVCPIQAKINVTDKDGFFQGCNLTDHEEKVRSKRGKGPEEYKDGLWSAVHSGEYRGHHHDPGTVPCFTCDHSKIREEYHFPWEVTRLSDHINDYESARKSNELHFTDDNIAYNLSNPICANCFTSLEDSYPDVEFQSYGLDFSNYLLVEYSYKPNS